MRSNRRFLTSIVLTAAAGVCFSSLGCGDPAKTTKQDTTVKKTETTGAKPDAKKDDGKKADAKKPPESGSAVVPGGGVETPQ